MENSFCLWKMFFLHIVLSGMHKSLNGMPPPSRTVIDGRVMGYFIWRGDWFLMLIDLHCPTFFQQGGADLECVSSISEHFVGLRKGPGSQQRRDLFCPSVWYEVRAQFRESGFSQCKATTDCRRSR